jgi:hypothetical protein
MAFLGGPQGWVVIIVDQIAVPLAPISLCHAAQVFHNQPGLPTDTFAAIPILATGVGGPDHGWQCRNVSLDEHLREWNQVDTTSDTKCQWGWQHETECGWVLRSRTLLI